MEVFKKSISTIFGTERRYVIPLFQRPYVWTQAAQWEPLWEDVQSAAELELSDPQREFPPHFLGAIVMQQRPSWGDELMAHDVIDGQQRLTTFQILLSAFHDLASALEELQIANVVRTWTRNQNAIANTEVEQFKVWPTNRDVDQFRLVCTSGSRAAIEKVHPPVYKRKRLQPRPRMVEAYLFFYDCLTDWLDTEGSERRSDRIKALRRVFDRRMQLVSIELEKQEDPQVIFETLNARGVPLLASDLLRNYIFQRAKGDAELLHQKYWARFEVPDDEAVPDGARLWEVEERQGRLSRARLDLFVQHYLSMKRGTDVLSSHLFREYKDWIKKDAPFGSSVEDELRDFTAFAEQFLTLLRPTPTTASGKFAERLRALDTSTVYPLVLGLMGRSDLDAGERDGIFADLESFLVRRLVCGRPTKNYNRFFLQLLRDFHGKPPTRAAFRAILCTGSGEAVDWPSDTAFERAWNDIDAYRELKSAKVGMLLRAINDAMTTSATESITINGPLTVEHVMPQKWKPHWPLPTDVDMETAAEARENIVHDFGNLTLITQPLNTAASNGPAAQKLPKIAANAALRLSVHFQGRTTWTESDIKARTAELFVVAKRVWSGP